MLKDDRKIIYKLKLEQIGGFLNQIYIYGYILSVNKNF